MTLNLKLLEEVFKKPLIVSIICVLLLLLSEWKLIPPLDPTMVLLVVFVLMFCALLTVANFARRIQENCKRKHAREARRFVEIYSPLYSLFFTLHLIQCSLTGAPHLHDRIDNAVQAWCDTKNLCAAVRALFDRQVSEPSAEVEYGGDFPFSQIQEILKKKNRFADKKLLDMVRSAGKKRYECIQSRMAI